MSPEAQEFLKQFGMSAIFILMLWQIYRDGKAERAEMLDLLRKIEPELDKIKDRIMRLEFEFNIVDPPTKPKRPIEWLGTDGEIKK